MFSGGSYFAAASSQSSIQTSCIGDNIATENSDFNPRCDIGGGDSPDLDKGGFTTNIEARVIGVNSVKVNRWLAWVIS